MKRCIWFLFVFLAVSAWADNISEGEALKMAQDFFQNSHSRLSVGNLKMVYDGETVASRASGASPAFYVFNNPNGKGFVIVAGDDFAEPILGYSYDYEFPENNLPPNVEGWLAGLKRQINDGRKYGVLSKPSSKTVQSMGEVVKKLDTPLWNQGYPYNQYCPKIIGQHAPTGCVITAAAIVMRYHQWPEKGTGTLPEYTTSTKGIMVPGIELGNVYNWKQMPYNYSDGKYTEEQAHEVARLMADLGVMSQVDYDLTGSGAVTSYLSRLLPIHMNYDKSSYTIFRDEYNEEDWHQYMTQELSENRPIIYSGSNEKSGHTFVLDGYTTNFYYSVNWGWGGSCNGYFLLNALLPHGSGIGGNEDHYNYGQYAVVGLKPNEGGDYVERIYIGGTGLSTLTNPIVRNEPFILHTEEVRNRGYAPFIGEILWALTDKKGNIKEELRIFQLNEENPLDPGWGWSNFDITITITAPIEIGDRIRLFFKSNKMTDWQLIKGGPECSWDLLVADEYTIEESTNLKYNKKASTLLVQTKEGVDVQFMNGNGIVLADRCTNEGVQTTIRTEGLQAGVYKLKLKKTFESCEVKIRLGDSQE